MTHIFSILLTNYKSGGEAIVVGILQGLVLWGVVALFRGARKAVNGRKFEEVKGDSEKKSDKPEIE
jgi:hypothetical protein